jgi:hypothetical protein
VARHSRKKPRAGPRCAERGCTRLLRRGGRARIGRTRTASARSTVSGGGKMGSGNGSNVRTMRTRFPPGRKGGEQQQGKSLGLGLGVRARVRTAYPARA